MKRQIFAIAVVAMLLIPGFALAQVCNFDLRYDCCSVQTITGTVVTTVSYNPNNPMSAPQAFIVQSANQTYTVFLGPGWYTSQLGLSVSPGSTITATGSLRSICNTNYLVAQNVAWNNQIFVIRNANGVPLWSIIGLSSQPSGFPAPYGGGPSGLVVPFDQSKLVNIQGQIVSLSTIQTTDSCEPLLVATIAPTDSTCPSCGTGPSCGTCPPCGTGPASTVQVILAPQSFFAANNWNLCQGTCVNICGSSSTCNCQNFIVASRISTSCLSLNLRSNCGTPLWAAGAPLGAGPAPCGTCGACGAAIHGSGPCPSCGANNYVPSPSGTCPPTGTGPCNTCPPYMVVPPPPADMCD